MMDTQQLQNQIASLQDELDGVYLYNTLTKAEKDPRLAEVYRRMAVVEQRHADAWTAALKENGVIVPAYKPSLRTRALAFLAERLGPNAVLPTIIRQEQSISQSYGVNTAPTGMAEDEASHMRLLGRINRSMPGGMEGGALAAFEGRHRATGGNALRAAVLGANDGLLSNMSLVMGVAGAAMSGKQILITGLAGMLAGAFSMAIGEWLSVQSSRELYSHQIAIEKSEIATAPQEEAEELALIYEARGVNPHEARKLADQIMSDPANALQTLAREELSMDPQELGGSAWEAAITSFFLFSLGAIVPVIPFIFMSGTSAQILSIGLSLIGLFITGAIITLFTGRNLFFSGFRQVMLGLASAAITYLIGRIIGVSLAG
jgi:VIT1/CCC1 family predicted Fe2+/Mn2+ transporter